MKRLLLSSVIVLCAAMVQAQFWVTSVMPTPDPASECVPVSLAIEGQKPATNYNVTTASATVTGSTINVTLVLTMTGFGLPTLTPFSGTIAVGSLPAGSYTVQVDYTASGNVELSSWPLVVESCGSTCTQAPDNLSSSPNPTGSVTLGWDASEPYVACRVRGRKVGTVSWAVTSPVFGSTPTSFTVPSAFLDPGDNYEWQVQCACSVSPVSLTPWSSSGFFTAPVLRTEQGALESDISLLPNPATHHIQLNGIEPGSDYRIIDMTGRELISDRYNSMIDVYHLAPGWYSVLVNGQSLPFIKMD